MFMFYKAFILHTYYEASLVIRFVVIYHRNNICYPTTFTTDYITTSRFQKQWEATQVSRSLPRFQWNELSRPLTREMAPPYRPLTTEMAPPYRPLTPEMAPPYRPLTRSGAACTSSTFTLSSRSTSILQRGTVYAPRPKGRRTSFRNLLNFTIRVNKIYKYMTTVK